MPSRSGRLPIPRASLIWLAVVLLHVLFLALAAFTTILRDTPLEAFGITAVIVPYALQYAGLPMLEKGGSSGWGWPSPNPLGWFASVVAWLLFYWLIAVRIERLIRWSRRHRSEN